jgi:hypothetical protein
VPVCKKFASDVKYAEAIMLPTHLNGCKVTPCTCSPVSRIRLLEYLKMLHTGDPKLVESLEKEIQTLKKVAVIYTHSPHLVHHS